MVVSFLKTRVGDYFYPKTSHPEIIGMLENFDSYDSVELENVLLHVQTVARGRSALHGSTHKKLELLEEKILLLKENSSDEGLKNEIRELYYSVVGELKKVAVERVKDYQLAEKNSHLVELYKELTEFIKSPADDAIYKKLASTVEKAYKRREALFFLSDSGQKETIAASLNSILTLLNRVNSLPDSLKHIDGLVLKIKREILDRACQTINIVKEELEREGKYVSWISNFLKTIESSATDAMKSLLPKAAAKHYSSFEQLSDALDFLKNSDDYTAEEKREILLSLRNNCNGFAQGFMEDCLFENIEEAQTAFKDALNAILGTTDLAKEALITEVNKRKLGFSDSAIIKNPKEQNELMTSINRILGSGTQYMIKLLCTTVCDHLLLSKPVQAWKEKQTPEIQGVIDAVANSYKIATKPEDFKNILDSFKTILGYHLITIDGFDLPRLLNEDILAKQTAAVGSIEDALKEIKESLKETHTLGTEAETSLSLDAQTKLLSENLRCFALYSFVSHFFMKKGENVFPHIVQAQKQFDHEKQRTRFFKKEMKKIILESNSSWIWKKIAIYMVYPLVEYLAKKHVPTILSNVSSNLQVKFDQLDKELFLQRVENALSKYNKLLVDWAQNTHGGDKRSFVREHMQSKDFLSFNGTALSEKELYKKFSETLIEEYIDILPRDNPDFVAPSVRIAHKKSDLFKTSVILGIIGYVPLSLLQIGSSITEKIYSASMKFLIKKVVSQLNLFSSGVSSARETIFDKNPYVSHITSFIADQFQLLASEIDKPRSDDPSDELEKFEPSDQTRRLMKANFESIFEILKKDSFITQEKLNSFLQNRKDILAKASDTLDDKYLVPLLEDGLIDISAIAFEKLLTKSKLEKPLASLYQNINESLITAVEDQETLEQKSMQAQQKLNYYTQKILKKSISLAISEAIVPTQEKAAKKFKQWLNEAVEDLADCLTNVHQCLLEADKSEEEKRLALKGLLKKQEEFLSALEEKKEVLEGKHPQLATDLIQRSKEIIGAFKDLSIAVNTLYENFQAKSQAEVILPFYHACDQAFNDLSAKRYESPEEKAYFCQKMALFEKVKAKEINDSDLKTAYQTREKSISSQKRAIEGAFDDWKKLCDLKVDISSEILGLQHEHQELMKRPFFRSKKIQEQSSYKKLMTKIDLAPLSAEDKLQCKAAILGSIVNPIIDLNLSGLDTAIATKKNLIQDLRSELIKHLTPIHKILEDHKTVHMQTRDKSNKTYDELIATLAEKRESLETHNVNFTLPSFAHIDILPDWLRSGVEKTVYKMLEPKLTQMLSLARDGNFAQFLANHTIVLPAVSKS